jgi:hypothetical protein
VSLGNAGIHPPAPIPILPARYPCTDRDGIMMSHALDRNRPFHGILLNACDIRSTRPEQPELKAAIGPECVWHAPTLEEDRPT